jgi:hypothetical protein
MGAVLVGDRVFEWVGPGRWPDHGFDGLQTGTNRAACLGVA